MQKSDLEFYHWHIFPQGNTSAQNPPDLTNPFRLLFCLIIVFRILAFHIWIKERNSGRGIGKVCMSMSMCGMYMVSMYVSLSYENYQLD